MKLSLVAADESGKIHDCPDLRMLVDRGGRLSVPEPEDVLPLPEESELFLLPGRRPLGQDRAGRVSSPGGVAVAAFPAPGYTISAHAACEPDADAPLLPLFAYGAVGFARGRFWIAATCVDREPRQRFSDINPRLIAGNARRMLERWPENRLVGHIVNNCVMKYDCPAARNFVLGRYEAPLPTSRACNASCIGCISSQPADSPIEATPQCRMGFTPDAREIAEVMAIHESREKRCPVYSFGQGCEGDPLANPGLLADSIRLFRNLGDGRGKGTINCNTNASRPDCVEMLAAAGLTSMRVSLNSATPEFYAAYYRPNGYGFDDVRRSIMTARRAGIFVSLNLLYFPGFSDTPVEMANLAELCRLGVEMIQLRNLNIDPRWYRDKMGLGRCGEDAVGVRRFMRILGRECPWLRFGYYNPYLGKKAALNSPAG